MPLRTLTPAAVALVVFVSGCASAKHATNDTLALAGIDTESLVPRERATLERLLGSTYAPCPDQAVSLDVCITEKRPCEACGVAARFLANRVTSGLAPGDVERAYEVRFGSKVWQVDVADSPTRGPANAPVTLMVWSDFECPSCKHVMPLLDRVVEEHPDDVRLVHKLYPLPKHVHSEYAARASYAAKLQGKYWELERALFENQSSLSEPKIDELAGALGLDMQKYRADAASEEAKRIIQRDMRAADDAGLSGTPFILINGREFDYSLFHVEVDLDAWVEMEIELKTKR